MADDKIEIWVRTVFGGMHEKITQAQAEEQLLPGLNYNYTKYILDIGTGTPDMGNPIFDYDFVEQQIVEISYTEPPSGWYGETWTYSGEGGEHQVKAWHHFFVDKNWQPPPDIRVTPAPYPDGDPGDGQGFFGTYTFNWDGSITDSTKTYTFFDAKQNFYDLGMEVARGAVRDALATIQGGRFVNAYNAIMGAVDRVTTVQSALMGIHQEAFSTLQTLNTVAMSPEDIAAALDSLLWKAQRDAKGAMVSLFKDASVKAALSGVTSDSKAELTKALVGTVYASLEYIDGVGGKYNLLSGNTGQNFDPAHFDGEDWSAPGTKIGSIYGDHIVETGWTWETVFAGAGNDTIEGNLADYLDGGTGNDTYDLRYGSPTIHDESGVDRIVSSYTRSLTKYPTIENLTLTGSSNINATGNTGANRLTGNSGKNSISGGGGSDTINGGAGKDQLTGGNSADQFVFSVKPSSSNIDTISDFKHNVDLIVLEDSIFKGIGATLDKVEFYAAPGAVKGHDGTDRIVYNRSTGNLYYDSDGNGSHAAVLFATLLTKPTLDAGDFLMI